MSGWGVFYLAVVKILLLVCAAEEIETMERENHQEERRVGEEELNSGWRHKEFAILSEALVKKATIHR